MKTSKKSDSWSYPSFADSWREDFIKLIPRSKRRKEIIKYVKLIDWKRIGHLLSLEAKTVMKKIGVPESNDSLRLNSSIVEGIILANIKDRLLYLLLHYLSSINKTDTKKVTNRKIKGLLDRVEFEIIRNRAVFNTIVDFSSLKWIKDSDTMQIEFERIKKRAEKGDKFSRGKQVRSYEVPSFENIKREYKRLKKEGRNPKYRSIAFFIARTEQGLIHKREQENFYNRFLAWLKKNK